MPKVKEDVARIFFATDVHGSEITFRKFTNAAKFYRADVLVLGGDVTGKTVVPIAKKADGTYTSSFLNQQHNAKNEQELKDLTKKIENSGSYWSVMEQQEAEALKVARKRLMNYSSASCAKDWLDGYSWLMRD